MPKVIQLNDGGQSVVNLDYFTEFYLAGDGDVIIGLREDDTEREYEYPTEGTAEADLERIFKTWRDQPTTV